MTGQSATLSADQVPQRRALVGHPFVWRLAVGFVVLTLIALVLIPLLVQRRVRSMREEIAAADPARTLVTRWESALAQEAAA
ncbi:MAG TPA: hypothetical protein VK864_09325, partial [Longimicrobiales bacterium]|nr:hypothetical protein [Longimicrobiales bacterium]